MSQKREELIRRVAEAHDTWFVEETVYLNRRYYRLRESRRGAYLLPKFGTAEALYAFLDGYRIGKKDAELEGTAPPGMRNPHD